MAYIDGPSLARKTTAAGVICHGFYRTKRGKRHRYRCRERGQTFIANIRWRKHQTAHQLDSTEQTRSTGICVGCKRTTVGRSLHTSPKLQRNQQRLPGSSEFQDGRRLQGWGDWVNVQRTKKDTLLPERRRRLDELGFVWNVREQQWDEAFTHLQRYRETNNDCPGSSEFHNGRRLQAGQVG